MSIKILPKLETKINQKNLKVKFDGGQITSDAGLLLVKKMDERLGFMDNINKLIEDPRDPKKITHTQQQLLSQRIYQIIAGYEDCDDADLLKNDPIFKIVADKKDIDESLGSQPTLSRLENRITRGQITKLKRRLVEQYIRGVTPKKNQPFILDCDSTEDPTHGDQQLSLFSGLFDKECYHPLLVFDYHSQTILGAHLRPGNHHPARNARRVLLPIITRLKQKWHKKQIIIRGDSSFGNKKMADFCLYRDCDYIFAIGNMKNRFDKYTAALIEKANQRYEKTKKDVVMYSSFWHSSRKWKEPVKIRVQIKVNSQSIERRFLLTSLSGASKELFELYDQRGQCENYIKELKLGFKADRLSCHDFKANFFRLLLHCFAYQLIILFKGLLSRLTNLGQAQIDTLRLTLFKIGAVVYEKARWIWIRFSSSWPFRHTFLILAKKLGFG